LSLPLKYGCVLDPHTKASAALEAYRLRLLKRKNECQSTGWTVALISRPTQVLEFGQEETSLAFVGPAANSCPDPNLARGLTRSVSDRHFSNSRGRALVSERHREIAQRPNPV